LEGFNPPLVEDDPTLVTEGEREGKGKEKEGEGKDPPLLFGQIEPCKSLFLLFSHLFTGLK